MEMKKSIIDKDERQKRMLLLQEYWQWRTDTGSNSRMAYAREQGISLQYLINCLKWHHEECKRNAEKATAEQTCGNPKGLPLLVAVKNTSGQPKAVASGGEGTIRIRMKASSIDLSGDIAPTLLVQLLSTLGALNVL